MREVLKKGWKVTTSEVFKIKLIAKFQTVEHWVDFHERNPKMTGNGRIKCSCCNTPWKTIKTGSTWICMMENKRNQIICDKCADNFKELIIETKEK